jgi:uncharacterized protein YcbX
MPDLVWLQLIATFSAMLILAVISGMLLAGLIVTRANYNDMKARFQAELVRQDEDHRKTYDRLTTEYHRMATVKDADYDRMVLAKDLTIKYGQDSCAEWRAIALQALGILEVTGQQAAGAVEAVAARLNSPKR